MKKKLRRALGILALLAFVTLAAFLFLWWSYRDNLRAKTTVTRMRDLHWILQDYGQPCDLDCLRGLAEAWNRADSLTDAWGSDLIFEAQSDPISYTLRSLGKDRKIGKCCIYRAQTFNDDAVLQDGVWLQVWNY